MRKNFFKKKLATTVALAMVVASLTVPNYASAATATKIVKQGGKAAPTVLYVGDKGTDYGLSKTYKGNKYVWTISNSAIATINKSGVVTAKTPGTVTIKVTARDSKGKWLKAFTQKLTIRQRVSSVDIGSDDFSLYVNETKDLNAVKTPSTSTDSIRYYSDNEEVATVDAKTGLVKAVGIGEATVTVYAKAAWNTPTASKYNRTDSVKVTVLDGIQSLKQTTTNKVELGFATDQSTKLTTSNLTVTDADGIKQVVKEIKFSNDGKTATVELYLDLTDGTTYKVAYDNTEKSFTASVGDVASIVLSGKTVQYDTATDLELKAFDKNGVDVSSKVDDWDDVEFDYEESDANIDWDDEDDVWQVTVYDYPKSLTVKATYTVFDEDKDEEVKFESSAVIKSVKEIANVASEIKYTVLDADDYNDVDWDSKDDVTDTIPAEAEGYRLFIKAKDQNGDDIYEYNFDSFESSDKDILTVSYDEDGKDDDTTAVYVDPVKAGTAYIKAKYGDTTKLLKITVGSKVKATKISVNSSNVELSDSTLLGGDSVVIDVNVKDQYNNEMTYDDPVEYVHKSGDSESIINVTTSDADSTLDKNQIRFSVNADAASRELDGNNTYELTLNDKSIKVYVKVFDVIAGTNDTVSKLGLDATHTSLDAVATKDTDNDKVATFTVYAYNKDGAKIEKVAADFSYTLDSKSLAVVNTKGMKIDEAGAVASLTALQIESLGGDNVATQAATGVYKVKAVVGKDAYAGYTKGATLTASLKVTNTQPVPTVTQEKSSLSVEDFDTVSEVIAEAFKIKRAASEGLTVVGAEVVVGGSSYENAAALGVGVKAGDTVRVKSITVYDEIKTNVFIKHKITVNNKSVKITK